MIPFIINLAVAFIWLMLSTDPSILDFLIGFVLGFFLLIPFQKFVGGAFYVRRLLGFIFFVLNFLWEFLLANLNVAYIILFVDKRKIKPTFFDFDVTGMTRFEILILTHCITLTPGTITVDILEGEQKIIVHCLDYRKPEALRKMLYEEFVEGIQRFSR